MPKLDIALTLLGMAITIFIVVTITWVGMKQLDHSIKSAPTCFPPYFLMKADRQQCPTSRGFTAREEGVRSLGAVPAPKPSGTYSTVEVE